MKKIKEVTVFTHGDSTEIRTWSNVPFFFTTTLEHKGIVVNRVNIEPSFKIFLWLFHRVSSRILKRVDKKNTYDYTRSFLFKLEVNFKILKSVLYYRNTDAFIFLNFTFTANKITNKPSIAFGDWTYEHYLDYHVGKKPNFLERTHIFYENRAISQSDLVVPLFPKMAESLIQQGYGNIKYLGNVINCLIKPNKEELLSIKENSQKIIFIGSIKYIEGANKLLQVYIDLKEKFSAITLDFIGLEQADFDSLPEGVTCHGYLNKANVEERKLYYELLKTAKVFVNPTPKWSSFSASVEIMYLYTPVIVPPYEEFVQTFGEDFKGGVYCGNTDNLLGKIDYVLSSKNYKDMCKNANFLVRDFTWDSYIDNFLVAVENI